MSVIVMTAAISWRYVYMKQRQLQYTRDKILLTGDLHHSMIEVMAGLDCNLTKGLEVCFDLPLTARQTT